MAGDSEDRVKLALKKAELENHKKKHRKMSVIFFYFFSCCYQSVHDALFSFFLISVHLSLYL